MAFRFSNAAAVAAGTFNIHVVQARWLTEIGLFREGMKVQLKSSFFKPEFIYSSDELGVEWNVRPERLTIVTKKPDVDCGSPLATVIEKLPWTPLSGIGVNVEFLGELQDVERLPRECSLPFCNVPDGYATKQRSMHYAIERGPHIFNFQISMHEKADLAINVHTELKEKGSQSKNSKTAQEACLNFMPLRQEATDLAQRLFGVELNYEPNSD